MKRKIIEEVIERLKNKKALLERESVLAQEEANFHKGKMESRYDTFKEEAQYKVSVYSSKAAKINLEISILKDICKKLQDKNSSIVISSIVTVNSQTGKEQLMILPFGAGEIVCFDNTHVQIVSIESPLGKKLLKSELYDEIEINTGHDKIKFEIIEIK